LHAGAWVEGNSDAQNPTHKERVVSTSATIESSDASLNADMIAAVMFDLGVGGCGWVLVDRACRVSLGACV